MPHVISSIGVDTQGTRMPQVVIDLGGVAFATSDGTFQIPPIVPESGLPEEYAIVALLDADHAQAISLGYTYCVPLDPCSVEGV